MISDFKMKEAVLVSELGSELIMHLCLDDEIDQDHAMGIMLASLNQSQNIDMDRVLHFYGESRKHLEGPT